MRNKKSSTSEDGNKPSSDNSTEGIDSAAYESPKMAKLNKDKNKTNRNNLGYAASLKTDVNVIVEGENAMFPDNDLSQTLRQESRLNFSEQSANCGQPSDSVNQNRLIDRSVSNGDQQASNEENSVENNLKREELKRGWNSSRGESVTIAELYLMFGSDSKLSLEYDWVDKPSLSQTNYLTAQLTNMLRRLIHLATMEFSDFSKVCHKVVSFYSFQIIKVLFIKYFFRKYYISEQLQLIREACAGTVEELHMI